MLWPETTNRTDDGELTIGGLAVSDLAEEFGTPLYIYDEVTLRQRARRAVASAFAGGPGSRAVFASKALELPVILAILADEDGLGVHPRRVTLSTVGVLPALARLAEEPLMPNLAISLHATTDAQRSAIVPINRRYDLEALLEACRAFPVRKRSRITFEYVLLAGVNDDPADARRLARLLGGIKAKVNLLPLNEAEGIPFTRPDDESVNTFARILSERDVRVSVRKSRGRDIRAACGQLLVEKSDVQAPAGADLGPAPSDDAHAQA